MSKSREALVNTRVLASDKVGYNTYVIERMTCLKTVWANAHVGSNPTPSANSEDAKRRPFCVVRSLVLKSRSEYDIILNEESFGINRRRSWQ